IRASNYAIASSGRFHLPTSLQIDFPDCVQRSPQPRACDRRADVSPSLASQSPGIMTDTISRIWSLFAPQDRQKAILMLVLIVLVALVETAGVLSIMPFLSVLSRPGIIEENEWLRTAFDASGLGDPRSFPIALGLASILVVVCSS